MKFITPILFFFILISCSSVRVKTKRTYLNDILKGNQLYSIKDNSYFYFMIDSVGNKHLVKMSLFNVDKVLWIEKLNIVPPQR